MHANANWDKLGCASFALFFEKAWLTQIPLPDTQVQCLG